VQPFPRVSGVALLELLGTSSSEPASDQWPKTAPRGCKVSKKAKAAYSRHRSIQICTIPVCPSNVWSTLLATTPTYEDQSAFASIFAKVSCFCSSNVSTGSRASIDYLCNLDSNRLSFSSHLVLSGRSDCQTVDDLGDLLRAEFVTVVVPTYAFTGVGKCDRRYCLEHSSCLLDRIFQSEMTMFNRISKTCAVVLFVVMTFIGALRLLGKIVGGGSYCQFRSSHFLSFSSHLLWYSYCVTGLGF
jgi:hypothetical protein